MTRRSWKSEINRVQPALFILLVAGLIAWPIFGRRVGLSMVGGAVVAAGMIPVVTGRYRTKFGRLDGMPARLRGLFSVALGALVLLAAWS